jgi:hypothetical protein
MPRLETVAHKWSKHGNSNHDADVFVMQYHALVCAVKVDRAHRHAVRRCECMHATEIDFSPGTPSLSVITTAIHTRVHFVLVLTCKTVTQPFAFDAAALHHKQISSIAIFLFQRLAHV